MAEDTTQAQDAVAPEQAQAAPAQAASENEAQAASENTSGQSAQETTLLGGEARAGQAQARESATAAPEKYDLRLPEGMALQPEQRTAFENQARELGLDAAQAQKLLEMAYGNHTAAMQAQAAQARQWAEQAKGDAEIGGEHFSANVATANKALQMYDPDGAIAELLTKTGYANHPQVVKMLWRIGRDMAEDNSPKGEKGELGRLPLEDRLYSGWKV